MPSPDAANLHVHITWDSEPTAEAKEFIREEVLAALQEALGEGTWLKELVETEVKRAVSDIGKQIRISSGSRHEGLQRHLPKGSPHNITLLLDKEKFAEAQDIPITEMIEGKS